MRKRIALLLTALTVTCLAASQGVADPVSSAPEASSDTVRIMALTWVDNSFPESQRVRILDVDYKSLHDSEEVSVLLPPQIASDGRWRTLDSTYWSQRYFDEKDDTDWIYGHMSNWAAEDVIGSYTIKARGLEATLELGPAQKQMEPPQVRVVGDRVNGFTLKWEPVIGAIGYTVSLGAPEGSPTWTAPSDEAESDEEEALLEETHCLVPAEVISEMGKVEAEVTAYSAVVRSNGSPRMTGRAVSLTRFIIDPNAPPSGTKASK